MRRTLAEKDFELMPHFESLNTLAATCAQCQKCELHTQRTHSVFSDGVPTARIMIVGEGPGYYEDQQGKPFVGKSGQLLDQMFAAIGLDRQRDLYIANVVKCRPPENRKPHRHEMEACFDYLKQQIEIVRPWILVLTGATALEGITGEKRAITRCRGEWFVWGDLGFDIDCVPIFHPAYLLRNPERTKDSPKGKTWQDLKQIAQRYRNLQQKNPESV